MLEILQKVYKYITKNLWILVINAFLIILLIISFKGIIDSQLDSKTIKERSKK